MLGHHTENSSSPPPLRARRLSRSYRVWVPACVAVTFCCAAALPRPSRVAKPQELPAQFITAPVTHGTLQNVLAEQGLVDAAENFVVASKCESTQRILRLIPEGEWVEAGQIVVELDASELEVKLEEREIKIINAQAELLDAREALHLQELENASALAQAALAKQLARLDLEKYLNGEFPKQQKEAEAAVAIAREDVARARERHEYLAHMARKGYESPMEVESQRLMLLKHEQTLDNARRELQVLVQHTFPRELAELQALESESKRELVRVRQQAELALMNRQILVQNRETQHQQQVKQAEQLRRNIAACTIRSPRTGEIIYANEGSIRNEIVEGEKIRYRQEVVRIPNLDQLQVKVRIHESQITGVAPGLEAEISVDAFPGQPLRGHVTSVSAVPTSGSYYTRDLKEYDAAIRIDAAPAQVTHLKPGLTAQVDIRLSRRDDCLHVPPQSIVDVSGHPIAFVRTAAGVEPREVQIGLITDTGVEVLSGLQQDEQVLLSPRTTCSQQIIALTDQYGSEISVENIGG